VAGDKRRAERSAARREAILAAALDEFSARGFEGARLDDVARRAGVAKGTIYLHFKDKETLFQELVRSALSPFVTTIEAASAGDMPLRKVLDFLAGAFVSEVLGTRRKDIVRLVLTEGRRFPKLAEFYYREVPERAFAALRALVRRAVARGEIVDDTLAKFPQLLIAPGLVAILWDGLFDKYERLDAEAMLRAQFDLLFSRMERRAR
jgi:AcrR family transcriptional regulator